MSYEIKFTSQFKKDLKVAQKQHKNLDLLFDIIDKLANDIPLDVKFRDHNLAGNYSSYRECHIEPDWLLVYKKDTDILVLLLYRLGSHSNLF